MRGHNINAGSMKCVSYRRGNEGIQMQGLMRMRVHVQCVQARRRCCACERIHARAWCGSQTGSVRLGITSRSVCPRRPRQRKQRRCPSCPAADSPPEQQTERRRAAATRTRTEAQRKRVNRAQRVSNSCSRRLDPEIGSWLAAAHSAAVVWTVCNCKRRLTHGTCAKYPRRTNSATNAKFASSAPTTKAAEPTSVLPLHGQRVRPYGRPTRSATPSPTHRVRRETMPGWGRDAATAIAHKVRGQRA